ncbi:MAG TPA: RNA polymerase sigma factor [Candidatus Cybelea sp.]|jgi:RNA polymerase sigma-70 factor, ECF subfamily|nr:RNA polymerase sigma factor [Candidatus Cybelea sp.]
MRTNDVQAAFVDRLDRHRGILVKVAGAYCRDAAGREDLIAEIVAQLWRAYGRFDERAAFSTWMYRIAVNVAISFHRSEVRKAMNVEAAEPAILELLPSPPETQGDDALALVREFIEELDELNRALMLLYLDDNSYAEIAAILGISETNVATKIGRIKQRLKRDVAARNDV